MPSLVHGDLDSMMRLKVGLVTSANKYASEASLLRSAANGLEQASETNTHDLAVEQALEMASRLETLGAAIDAIADGLTPEIERLSALVELTRKV